MKRIDLNCDLGEGVGHDAELLPLITSANIACGAHAGNSDTMRETVALAHRFDVQIGAHPGFRDKVHFGRLELPILPDDAATLVSTQVATLAVFAGERLRHVKLHGALYHQVSRDLNLARAVARRLARDWPKLFVYALHGSIFARECRSVGLTVASEVFADRTYLPDGSLTPRTHPGALVTDGNVAVKQVMEMVLDGKVTTPSGHTVRLTPDTVCLHGDGAEAIGFARRLRLALAEAGVEVARFAPSP